MDTKNLGVVKEALELLKKAYEQLDHTNVGGDSIFGDGQHIDSKCLKCKIAKFMGIEEA